jgi:uncharacterized membrane protein
MKARLSAIQDRVRTGLWFVPLLMATLSVALAGLIIWADATLASRPARWWIYFGSPDDARSVLVALLTSMITMTSLVFSVTMVVLTLASNQFGPRIVRNFMASMLTQFTMGAFVMAILY